MRWLGAVVSGISLLYGGSHAQAVETQSNAPTQVSPAAKTAAEAASRAEAVKAFEKTLKTQDRLNRYFHDEVGPRLTPCWAPLKGKGTIFVQIQYSRAGSRWRAGESTIRSSTMRKAADPRALECLKRAVKDTSFAVEDADGEAKEFFVNWGLPVPWPKNMNEVVARMIDTGGGRGECGPETPAQCWDCAYIKILSLPGISFCSRTCVGYQTCSLIEGGCKMGPIRPMCSSGSPFGNAGGVIAY
jgi:hypothetical protein